MNVTLTKALVALVPAGMLLAGSGALLLRAKTPGAVLQLLGAACLVVVVLMHVAEALQWLPGMHWGEHSVGHYLDLSSAVLGVTLLPVGYVLHRRGDHPCTPDLLPSLRTRSAGGGWATPW